MASRSAPSRRRSGAAPARSSANPALLVGGGAVVAVILVIAFARSGDDTRAAGGQHQPAAAKPAAATPSAAPAAVAVSLGGAKAGKTPEQPAPPLTLATLQELQDLLTRIKTLRNEAVTARTGSSDVQKARASMGEAKQLLEQWEAKVAAPLGWQEQAQLENWAQPAEYVTLESLYATYARLDNEVRKGGG